MFYVYVKFFISCALYCQPHEMSVSFDTMLQFVLLIFYTFPWKYLKKFEYTIFQICRFLNTKAIREKLADLELFEFVGD